MKIIRRDKRTDPPVEMKPENRPEEHPDKRFRRTDRILRETLLNMLDQGRIVDITTTELCRRADVSRNTFYAHYTAVEHLYDDMENDFIRAQIAAFEVTVPGPDCTPEQALEANIVMVMRILDIIKENRRLISAVVAGNVQSDFYRKLYPLLRDKTRPFSRAAARLLPGGDYEFDPLFLYLFHGSRAILDHWIAHGMVEDTRSLAELLVRAGIAVMISGAGIDLLPGTE